MTVRDGRGDVKQTTAGFRGPLMVQSLTSAKSKFLSLDLCHEIDLVQWLAGPYQSMTALGGKVSNLEIDSDDVFALLLELQNCPIATLTMNYLDTVLSRELIAHTDRGTLRANIALKTFSDGAGEEKFSAEPDDTYIAQLTAFLSDDQDTLCSLSEGLSVNKVIAAAETASAKRTWLKA